MTPSEKARDKRLRETYNMSLEEHNAKRAEQKNACAICRRPFSQFQAYQDHDHACCARRKKRFCGKCNRALLCFLCNKKGVAWAEYMKKVGIDFEKVIQYLKEWNAKIKERGGYVPEEKATKKLRSKQKSI